MLTTVFLSKVFGYYLVIMGVFLLTRFKVLKLVVDELIKQRSSLFIIAMINIFIGVYLVAGHNYWIMAWPVIITILAWLVLIAGILRLYFPDCVISMARCIMKRPVYATVIGVIDLLIGFYLLHHVYMFHW